ncbi:voltage-dependent L-type calcium channel subunit alpha-1D isoform X2 [Hydra vulgaris]|uniref:Voltage-dependent L-type calcium channel subunit alpha-1D isoform X2 n=2 Tax=Hydra vulgaris TaxID=6087 RepID=A0ABM4BY15_HYDVU
MRGIETPILEECCENSIGKDDVKKQCYLTPRSACDEDLLSIEDTTEILRLPPKRSYRCDRNFVTPVFQQSVKSNVVKPKPDRSLFVFSENSFVRVYCKKIVENKLFEYFMLSTIAANCVVLMFATPTSTNDNPDLSNRLEQGDMVFVAIFTVEAILKIIVYGFFFNAKAYLKSGWNILDFVVVFVGLIQMCTVSSSENHSSKRNSEWVRALRSVRVLRPLKLVSGIPSLQILMKSLFRAMVPLLQILLLVLFVIVIFSIVGLELLRGRYHYACFNISYPGDLNGTLKIPHDNPRPCDNGAGWGRKCINGTQICRRAEPYEWTGPNSGITSFDNIFLAMLTVFQCITLESWTEILFLTIDSRDKKMPILTWGAFIILIVIGSFFMLNLVLGVLSGEFAKERQKVENRKSFLRLRKKNLMDRQYDSYIKWIEKAEEILNNEEEETEDEIKDVLVNKYNGQTLALDGKTVIKKKLTAKRSRLVEKNHNLAQKYEKKLRSYVHTIIKTKAFYWIVLVLVFLNTISIACRHYKQSAQLTILLETSESVFTILFFMEMLIQSYGVGMQTFLKTSFNRFDFAVVWLSTADLAYNWFYSSNSIGISVLRSIRLLRIFELTRFWTSMENMISSLRSSIRSILSLILLLLLFIFIFALLGMQLFGGQFHASRRIQGSRTNFDSFPKAMLAVFQIMTGESWNTVMYQGITAFNGPKSVSGMIVSLYFVALVIIGNYTLLNVFLAIAVDNLANAQVLAKDAEEQKRRELERKKAISAMYAQPTEPPAISKWGKVRSIPKIIAFTKKSKEVDEANPFKGYHYRKRPIRAVSESEAQPGDALRNVVMRAHGKFMSLDQSPGMFERRKPFLPYQQSFDDQLLDLPTIPGSPIFPPPTNNLLRNFVREETIECSDSQCSTPMHTSESHLLNSWKVLKRRNLHSKKVLNARSLLLFSPSSRLRTGCHAVVTWQHFEHIMLIFIVLSCIFLSLENPLCDFNDVGCQQNLILLYADIGIVSIFALEIAAKLVDQGGFAHKGSYLRDWWNLVDSLVVACNIAANLMAFHNLKFKKSIGDSTVKGLRILRVLRTLRVINKIHDLKLVFQCVVFSLKRVLNIIIITMLCLFMFAVIGNHLFQGKFHYCTDHSKLTQEECQGEFLFLHTPIENTQNYTLTRREWKNAEFNFDSIPIAILTLFSCGTGEAWPSVMQYSIDATGVDQGPIPDNNIFLSLYYVFFVVIFSFFFLNIFVALIIVTFQEQGEKEIIGSELNKNQRACLQFVLNAKPRQRFMPVDKSGFSYKVWCIVDSKPFEILILVIISLNAVVLMLAFDGQSVEYKNILDIINVVFTCLFTAEAVLKLMAYKLNYFRMPWNVFDFVIVCITLIGASITIFRLDSKLSIDPSLFRLFRAFRLLKLLRQGYNIRILIWTFLQSLKAMPYIMLLIAMLFFIYAVIGMQLFSRIANDNLRQINEYNNFKGFFSSLGVLFRCGTGEGWHLIMMDCFDHAKCELPLNGSASPVKCGSTIAAVLYFCSFYFFCAFLLLNLFVAVIMDNFDYLTRDESILGPHHMDEFVRVWSLYDPSALGRIPHEDVYQLMCDMQPPVGFGKKCPKSLAYKRLMKLNMPISGDNTVLFTPTIFALVRTSLRMTENDKEYFKDSSFKKVIKRIWPNTLQKTLDVILPEQTVLSDQQITIGKIYAAKLIYESFKEIQRRKNCTLPQFEMFEAAHKRGNSLFQKMMGALRTSQSLVSEKSKSHLDSLSKRKRSQSNTSFDPSKLNDNPIIPLRMRSVSTAGFSRSSSDFPFNSYGTSKQSVSMQKSLPMLEVKLSSNGILNDFQEFNRSRRNSPNKLKKTDCRRISRALIQNIGGAFLETNEKSEDKRSSYPCGDSLHIFDNHHSKEELSNSFELGSPQNSPSQHDCVCNEAQSPSAQELTNSILTALRDPAKPILCFLNPQPRDHERSQTEFEQIRSVRTSETNIESRHNTPRFTVSLPLIKLEIPYDEDDQFIDIHTNNHRPLSNTDFKVSSHEESIPDLIQSTRRPLRTLSRSEQSISPSEEFDNFKHSENDNKATRKRLLRKTTSIHSDVENHSSDNKLFCEYNEQVNRQIPLDHGVQPHWIYKINENEEDTWC